MTTAINGFSLSRRQLLAGTSALGAVAALGSNIGDAFAKAPMLGTQAPYFYRFKIGNAEATVVSDGPLPLGDPSGAFLGLSKEEIAKQLSDNFLPSDNAVLEQNSLIVNTGSHLVLFDTGMGSAKDFGPTTGKLMNSIKQAGIEAKDIDAVVMSHAHIDHCGGNVGDDGKSLFPNAQFYIAQSDFDFWTDESKAGGPLKSFIAQARKNLLPVRDRTVFIKDGQEFLPGITAIAAHGHTVGHTDLHDLIGRQADGLYRRPHASSRAADAEAAHRVRLRHRSETIGANAREAAHDVRGEEDSDRRLPLRMARLRSRGQAGRRLPVLPGADEHGAVGRLGRSSPLPLWERVASTARCEAG